MSNISDNLNRIKATLQEGVALCAVSKYHPEEELQEAYDAGQRIFGESHVQELVRKEAVLPKDIEWHFIGHLQTNKVKYIAPFVSLIHSADSLKLIKEINKQGVKCGRKIPVLLQLHMAQEETKFGFTIDECRKFLESGEWKDMEGVEFHGIMTMATNCDDEEQWRKEFHEAKMFFEEVKKMQNAECRMQNNSQTDNEAQPNSEFCIQNSAFSKWSILSMGMSHDYPIAMEEGSTMVRVGTAIFGSRGY